MNLDYSNYFEGIWRKKALEPTPKKIKDTRRNRYLFIHNPRTAGSAIRDCLGEMKNEHIPISVYTKLFTPSVWSSIFKFGMCRNPFKRFVSTYNALAGTADEALGVNKFIDAKLEWFLKTHPEMVKPQHYFLCNPRGEILVDYLGRFEELSKAWKIISDKIGIKDSLPLLHASNKEPQELEERNKDIIFKLYKKDFKIFGYN